MKKATDVHPLRRLNFDNMISIMAERGKDGVDGFFLKNNIAMARSVKLLLETFAIEDPFCLEDARLGIVRKGSAHYFLNLIDSTLKEGDVVFLGRGSIVQIGELSADFDITGVAFDDSQLSMAFNGNVPSLFQQYAFHRVLHASPAEFDAFGRCLDALWSITQLPFDTRYVAGQYVGPMLSLYELCLSRQEERRLEPVSHRREIFNRFISLVNEHVQEAHALEYHADRLCLSARYLGTVVKAISGETAKSWIDRALVTKAKVMLRHTDRQVSEIADLLGFPNSSFFCRFFRERTGCTPQQYREEPK